MKNDFMDDDCDIEGNPLEDKWKYRSHQRYIITKIKNGLYEVSWQNGTTSTHSTQKGAEVMIQQLQLQNDGVTLNSIKHPRPPFLKRILNRIKYFFIRPKFSPGALEPALSEEGLKNAKKLMEEQFTPAGSKLTFAKNVDYSDMDGNTIDCNNKDMTKYEEENRQKLVDAINDIYNRIEQVPRFTVLWTKLRGKKAELLKRYDRLYPNYKSKK